MKDHLFLLYEFFKTNNMQNSLSLIVFGTCPTRKKNQSTVYFTVFFIYHKLNQPLFCVKSLKLFLSAAVWWFAASDKIATKNKNKGEKRKKNLQQRVMVCGSLGKFSPSSKQKAGHKVQSEKEVWQTLPSLASVTIPLHSTGCWHPPRIYVMCDEKDATSFCPGKLHVTSRCLLFVAAKP